MAHYAKIDDDNIVERVEKLDDFYEWTDTGELDESRAVAKLRQFFGDFVNLKKKENAGDNIAKAQLDAELLNIGTAKGRDYLEHLTNDIIAKASQ